jgi:hypothetical protein
MPEPSRYTAAGLLYTGLLSAGWWGANYGSGLLWTVSISCLLLAVMSAPLVLITLTV